MIHFHIITLFPDAIEAYLSSSILGRAREAKPAKAGRRGKKPLIKISYYDPKKFAVGKHKRVDQRPYGGGPGMVLEPTAMLRAAEAALKKMAKNKAIATSRLRLDVATVFFTTDGAQFDEAMAKKLSKKKQILLITGRYEGVDARVPKILSAKGGSASGGKVMRVSVGPYVLTGGELPAATLVDAVSRFVPGVLGKIESLERSRVSSPEVYTRPETLVWKGKKYRVPPVLKSGNHARIDAWRQR